VHQNIPLFLHFSKGAASLQQYKRILWDFSIKLITRMFKVQKLEKPYDFLPISTY